ncbi:MAG: TVP38/TMEM64 family protein [Desulfobacteraceae bacterium]|nr:TVP38/TMEM64 family protein [Desulfobacteraceae bacterium]
MGKVLNGNNQALVKALVFVGLIVISVYAVRFSPLSHYLTAPALQDLLTQAGFWAPLAFIVFYAAAICMFVPGTLLTGIGAVIFGPYWGFVYVWIGAMAGSTAAFLIARTLGRDFAASLVGKKLKAYDEAIAKNGFATVLYIRLVYVPFTIANFGMGLTKVRFRDYFFGTALGILTGTFIFTFFFGTLKEIWVSGDWSRLLSPQVFLSVGLLVFSFFIPLIVKRIRAEH